MQPGYAIVFVSDMQRSLAFYRDTLGLPLKFESPEWTELATEGVTAALHRTDAPASAPSDLDHSPAGCCQLGFQVDDVDETHERLIAAGVTCVRPPSDEVGVRLAKYLDPDGLGFSTSQPAAC
jgi:lactoylglutathione lyase